MGAPSAQLNGEEIRAKQNRGNRTKQRQEARIKQKQEGRQKKQRMSERQSKTRSKSKQICKEKNIEGTKNMKEKVVPKNEGRNKNKLNAKGRSLSEPKQTKLDYANHYVATALWL